MGDVVVVETAQHMDDGIGGANVAQELVAESLAFGGAFYKTGNIHYLDSSRNHTGGMFHLDQFGQPFIGYCDNTHIGLDGTKGEICRLGLGIAQTVEEG